LNNIYNEKVYKEKRLIETHNFKDFCWRRCYDLFNGWLMVHQRVESF